jgi:hypothetical protein
LIHLQKYPVISHYFGNVQILEFVEFLIKAILVAGHGGPQGCEMSRLPHFLDSQLTDGSEVSIMPGVYKVCAAAPWGAVKSKKGRREAPRFSLLRNLNLLRNSLTIV